jgi:hypothetical protein
MALLLFAGTGVDAQSDSDPAALLRPPLVKLAMAARSKTRFTYLDLNHTVNLSEKGVKIADTTQLFEVTYIGNQRYSRLLERNGRPLRGSDLEAEQRRYDDAVRDYAALDDATHGKLFFSQLGSYGIDLTVSGLASEYRSVVAGTALLPFCSCVMVDATPLPGAPQRKYRMWVDPAKEQLLRLDSTLLEDEGQDLKGGILSILWTYIDDVPLISQSHFDVYVRVDQKKVHAIVDHTYSRFGKFSDTSMMVPGEPVGKP